MLKYPYAFDKSPLFPCVVVGGGSPVSSRPHNPYSQCCRANQLIFSSSIVWCTLPGLVGLLGFVHLSLALGSFLVNPLVLLECHVFILIFWQDFLPWQQGSGFLRACPHGFAFLSLSRFSLIGSNFWDTDRMFQSPLTTIPAMFTSKWVSDMRKLTPYSRNPTMWYGRRDGDSESKDQASQNIKERWGFLG